MNGQLSSVIISSLRNKIPEKLEVGWQNIYLHIQNVFCQLFGYLFGRLQKVDCEILDVASDERRRRLSAQCIDGSPTFWSLSQHTNHMCASNAIGTGYNGRVFFAFSIGESRKAIELVFREDAVSLDTVPSHCKRVIE